MIYSDKFVWLHFPKCAGTKVEHLFERYYSDDKSIHQDLVGINKDSSVAWHDTIAKREERDTSFKLGDRVVICTIRKLPGWLLSRYGFEKKRSPQLEHDPKLLLQGKFLEMNGYINDADTYMRKFVPEDFLVRRDKLEFIRTEFFEQDFKRVFGKFIDVTAIPDFEYQKRENTSKKDVPEDIMSRIFNDNKELYDIYCPYWKKIEEIAYSAT